LRSFDSSREADMKKVLPQSDLAKAELAGLKDKIRFEKKKEAEQQKKGFWTKVGDFLFGSGEAPWCLDLEAPIPVSYILPESEAVEMALYTATIIIVQRDIREKVEERWGELEEREYYEVVDKKVEYSDYTGRERVLFLPVYSGEYNACTEDGEIKSFRVAVNGCSGDVIGNRPSTSFFGKVRGWFGW